jgi:hypothetical protein
MCTNSEDVYRGMCTHSGCVQDVDSMCTGCVQILCETSGSLLIKRLSPGVLPNFPSILPLNTHVPGCFGGSLVLVNAALVWVYRSKLSFELWVLQSLDCPSQNTTFAVLYRLK